MSNSHYYVFGFVLHYKSFTYLFEKTLISYTEQRLLYSWSSFTLVTLSVLTPLNEIPCSKGLSLIYKFIQDL